MKCICSNTKPATGTECGTRPNYNLTQLPAKYIFLLNTQGFVDVPAKELMSGNMYAKDHLVRFIKTK